MIPNDIIPSEPMRNAVTKTSETELVRKVREEILRSANILRPAELALTVESVIEMHLLATPAPEPQPEVAAEPVAWQKRSSVALFERGEHWTEWGFCDRLEADHIQERERDYDGVWAQSRPLYTTPSVVEEAVKAERCDGQLCYYHGCQALPGCAALSSGDAS